MREGADPFAGREAVEGVFAMIIFPALIVVALAFIANPKARNTLVEPDSTCQVPRQGSQHARPRRAASERALSTIERAGHSALHAAFARPEDRSMTMNSLSIYRGNEVTRCRIELISCSK